MKDGSGGGRVMGGEERREECEGWKWRREGDGEERMDKE